MGKKFSPIANMTPRDILISHMIKCVPERSDEIQQMWDQYNPEVELIEGTKNITINANGARLKFDTKTMEVFWLLGFSAWEAISCYCPHVVISSCFGKTVDDLLACDESLYEIEQSYRYRIETAHRLIEAKYSSEVSWPRDLPRPIVDSAELNNVQEQAAFELTFLAVGFILFHEFRHVMLEQEDNRPLDPREEEMACDVWAREFMTSKAHQFSDKLGHSYREVIRKRSMGLVLAAFIIQEITPSWEHGGNSGYFSVGSRLQAILNNTPLEENDDFWNLIASLLVGFFRKREGSVSTPAMSAKELTLSLISKI